VNYPKTENPDDVKHLGRCAAGARTAAVGLPPPIWFSERPRLAGPAPLVANEILVGAACQAIAMARLSFRIKENTMIIQEVPIGQIKPDSGNSRTHSGKQIRQIAALPRSATRTRCWSTKTLCSSPDTAATRLAQVPVIVIAGLSPARRRALGDRRQQRSPQTQGGDRERLAIEIPELAGFVERGGA
jgi:hypothetical protein